MFLIDQIVEARIAEAMERGEFDNLSGVGKPLQLDDDSHIPQELRVAYRLLKNAGCVPPEVELRREIAQAEELIANAPGTAERSKAAKRLNYLAMQLNLARRDHVNLRVQETYYRKLQARLSRSGDT
jgi:hypothetical protein